MFRGQKLSRKIVVILAGIFSYIVGVGAGFFGNAGLSLGPDEHLFFVVDPFAPRQICTNCMFCLVLRTVAC